IGRPSLEGPQTGIRVQGSGSRVRPTQEITTQRARSCVARPAGADVGTRGPESRRSWASHARTRSTRLKYLRAAQGGPAIRAPGMNDQGVKTTSRVGMAPPTGAREAGRVDRELLAAAQRGDEAAFVDLIRVRSDRLFAIAQRILRDFDQAEDALQDAL